LQIYVCIKSEKNNGWFNLLSPTGHVMHHQFNTLRTGDADFRF